MSAPFIVHVAAEPAEDLTQRCARCGRLLHDNKTGAPAPWSPGTRVAVSESGQVRMSVSMDVVYPDCEQAVREPASAAA